MSQRTVTADEAKALALAIIEQEHVAAPGWIDVTIGPKPTGERQGSLFETDC